MKAKPAPKLAWPPLGDLHAVLPSLLLSTCVGVKRVNVGPLASPSTHTILIPSFFVGPLQHCGCFLLLLFVSQVTWVQFLY